jgi:hypothetical protein
MADFPIQLKLLELNGGMARLATLSGYEFAVPTQALPHAATPGDLFECQLGSLSSSLNHGDRRLLGMALLGVVDN